MEILNFVGFFLDGNTGRIPEVNGIYAAFAGTLQENHTCDIKRLIYIGKAEGESGIRKRIEDHVNDRDDPYSGKQSYWEKEYCRNGEVILYAYAEHEKRLGDIESALIFRNQPVANIHSRDRYIGETENLWIECRGKKGTLLDRIMITPPVR